MLEVLKRIEIKLPELISTVPFQSMYIDYHPPTVERVWFQHEEYRVYLHKIHPTELSTDALFHPHPWKSAIKIVKGMYEMGIGHSSADEIPKIDCKLILPENSYYEMTEDDGWHYVSPIANPVYSIMVTGERSSRKMPIEPNKNFRTLTEEEIEDVISTILKVNYQNG